MDVFHGYKVFNHSVAGCEPVVFFVLVVVFFDWCHEHSITHMEKSMVWDPMTIQDCLVFQDC